MIVFGHHHHHQHHHHHHNNHLLTRHKGSTGEYWPEVLAVLTKRNDRGPYCNNRGPIFLSMAQASLVSQLFIVWHSVSDSKCTACFSFFIKSFQIFRIIKLARGAFLFFIRPQNLGKISIFLAFLVVSLRRMMIFTFSSLFRLQILNLPPPKQKYMAWAISMETVRTAKSPWRKNQSECTDLPKTGFAI